MRPVLERRMSLIDQLEIRLVDQRRGAEGRSPGTSRVVACQRAELLVDHREQAVESLRIAAPPGAENLGDVRDRIAWWHRSAPRVQRILSV
jgi:hypothetical protein